MAKRAMETVRIPKTEHQALLACHERLKALESGVPIPPSPGYGGVSPIDRDPELSAFIRERFGRYFLADIAACCRDQFGTRRAPSKSAIHRFWMRLNGLRSPLKRQLTPPKTARHDR